MSGQHGRCSERFDKAHKKIPMLESLLNIVTGHQTGNFVEKGIQHRCFPVNFAKLLKAPTLWYICGRVSLK